MFLQSSILASILGEMHGVDGTLTSRGRVAYVPQDAWLFAASIRNNITFGADYDLQAYAQALRVCALDADMASMLQVGSN
jgi:ABC-type multidrug transport system fused ATPase/permease subunit